MEILNFIKRDDFEVESGKKVNFSGMSIIRNEFG